MIAELKKEAQQRMQVALDVLEEDLTAIRTGALLLLSSKSCQWSIMAPPCHLFNWPPSACLNRANS